MFTGIIFRASRFSRHCMFLEMNLISMGEPACQRRPCFPVKTDILAAKISYHDVKPGDVIEGENYKVTLAPLYHPNGSYGYRIDYDGRSMVFATDCEHREDKLCESLFKLCENADLLIYDAQYRS